MSGDNPHVFKKRDSAELSQQMGQLCVNNDDPDVNFIVEGRKFPAHKKLLAAKSPYFRAMLFGDFIESSLDEIGLQVSADIFEVILEYMHSGCMHLCQSNEGLSELFVLADMYGLEELSSKLASQMARSLTTRNCLMVFDFADFYNLKTLMESSIEFMKKNSAEIEVVDERIIFTNCYADQCSALNHGDFNRSNYRRGLREHPRSIDQRIIFELKTLSIINCIKIQFWDRTHENGWYSYNIEVSRDKEKWKRLIDYSEYRCRFIQHLYFPPQAVRFIRLIGKYTSTLDFETDICVMDLNGFYMDNAKQPSLFRGLIVPNYNVATVEMGAKVIEGSSNIRDLSSIFNLNVENFVFNEIRKSIIVQLGQPYYINTLRLLFPTNESYSFYIETSLDQLKWDMAVDKREEQLGSYQVLTFARRPVTFFKIVGTISSGNSGIFKCSSFQCLSVP